MATINIATDLSDINETVDWRGFRVYSWNLPDRRPGLYLFVNINNGKVYVGASQNVHHRIGHHAAARGSPRKLNNAFIKYGRSSFLMLPICYWLDGTEGLLDAESDWIVYYDSIADGYNVVHSWGGVGKRGDEFTEIHLTAQRQPALRAKRSIITADSWKDPEIRGRRIEGMRAALSDPIAMANHAAAMAIVRKNPVAQAKHAAGVKAAWAASSPERRSKAAARCSKAIRAYHQRLRRAICQDLFADLDSAED